MRFLYAHCGLRSSKKCTSHLYFYANGVYNLNMVNGNMEIREAFSAAAKYLSARCGKTQASIARDIGMSLSSLNDYINGRREGDESKRRAISDRLGLPYQDMLALGQWIIDGNEPEVFLEQGGNVFFRDSRIVEPARASPADGQDISVADIVVMAGKIIESETEHRPALISVIKALHRAVIREEEMEELRKAIADLQQEVRALRVALVAEKKRAAARGILRRRQGRQGTNSPDYDR